MALGEWNVDEMSDRMPIPLLYEWMAYARLNPFSPQREDWRAAMIAATISNRISGLYGKKRPRAIRIDDLMPKFEQKRRKSPKEIYELVRMYAVLNMGAKDKKRV